MIKWPGYEECEEKIDVITNEIDKRMHMLMSPSHTPSLLMMIPPLLMPKQFSHLELRPSLWLDIIVMNDDNDTAYDGYHSLSGVDDDLTLIIFIFCSCGYNETCTHWTCHKIDHKCNRKFKKKCDDGIERNCVFLMKLPFPHAPDLNDNDELKSNDNIISSTSSATNELNDDSSHCSSEVNVKFIEHRNFVCSFPLSLSFLKK